MELERLNCLMLKSAASCTLANGLEQKVKVLLVLIIAAAVDLI